MPPVEISSETLKVPVKKLQALVDEAIAQGTAAMATSAAAFTADPGDAAKQAKHQKNTDLLAKAKQLKAGLEKSEELANEMCPQQVAMISFDFTD